MALRVIRTTALYVFTVAGLSLGTAIHHKTSFSLETNLTKHIRIRTNTLSPPSNFLMS